MFLLIGDILSDCIQMGVGNRDPHILPLPRKICIQQFCFIDPSRRFTFYLFNCLSKGLLTSQRYQQVYVVCYKIHSQDMDIILFTILMNVMYQSGTDRFCRKKGHPVLRCPDQMNVNLCEWHKSFCLINFKNMEIQGIW